MSTHSLSRQQLYNEVWSRPMVHVAKDHGLSDRGLAKICVNHQIPVPPRGYWAKKAHGHKVRQVPLPPREQASQIRFDVRETPAGPTPKPELGPEIEYEQRIENRIVVELNSRWSHPSAANTRRALDAAKPGDRGLLCPSGGCLDVCVSRPQVSRALRIMNALIRAFEARGWPLSFAKEGRGLSVTVLGETLHISLDEKTKQVPHTPTKWETDNAAWHRPPYDLAPAGVLRLRIGTEWWRTNERSDSERFPLEESLNKFMIRLIKTAIRERVDRERREQQKQEFEAAQFRREEEARRRHEEEKKEKQWDDWMNAWEKSRKIRDFASAVREAFKPVEPDGRIAEWLRWAAAYADRLDPLREGRTPASDDGVQVSVDV